MTNKSQLPKNYLYYEEEGLTNLCAVLSLVTQSYLTLCNPTDCSPPGSSVYSNSSGKNTGVGCHALLQGIFPTQGLNPGLLHCRQILYTLSHQGSPRILEWVAYPFSSGSSWPTTLWDDTLQWMALIPCPCRTLLSPHSFLILFLQGDSLYEHSLEQLRNLRLKSMLLNDSDNMLTQHDVAGWLSVRRNRFLIQFGFP